MFGSFQLCVIRGVPIRIHFTTFFLLLFIHRPGDNLLFSLLMVLLILLSVALHELGHTVIAQRYGIQVQDIIFSPMGGVARLRGLPEDPHKEIRIALAGPYVSLFLALVSGMLAALCMPVKFSVGLILFGVLSVINLFIFLFNLLPSFPMDGGRVLRGWLSLKRGPVAATEIASSLGKYMAIGFILLGLLRPYPPLLLIGIFVWMLSGSELRMMKLKQWQKSFTGTPEPVQGDFVASPPPYEQDAAAKGFRIPEGVAGDFIQTALDLADEVRSEFSAARRKPGA